MSLETGFELRDHLDGRTQEKLDKVAHAVEGRGRAYLSKTRERAARALDNGTSWAGENRREILIGLAGIVAGAAGMALFHRRYS